MAINIQDNARFFSIPKLSRTEFKLVFPSLEFDFFIPSLDPVIGSESRGFYTVKTSCINPLKLLHLLSFSVFFSSSAPSRISSNISFFFYFSVSFIFPFFFSKNKYTIPVPASSLFFSSFPVSSFCTHFPVL